MPLHRNSVCSSLAPCLVTVQSEVFKLNGQQIQLDPGVTEPPDKILWTHNGNKLMEFNGTVEKVFGPYVGRVTLNRLTAQLQISDLRFEDSGKYECEIQGKTPLSSHKLVVIGKVQTIVSGQICHSFHLKPHRLSFSELHIIISFDIADE